MFRTLRAAAFCAAVTAAAGQAFADDSAYPNAHLLTSTAELAALMEGNAQDDAKGGPSTLRIVDVRSREAFAGGHVPGAINIPFTALTDPHAHVRGALKSDDALAALFGANGIDATSHIVLYDDQGGFRAARLFWLLEYYGHRTVSLLDGGIDAWVRGGGDLQTPSTTKTADVAARPAEAKPTTFAVNLTPRRHASADLIMGRRNDANTVVIDVRPTKMYEAGHIPWADSIPWKGSLSDDGTIAPKTALMAYFASHGVTPDRAIIVHCETGEASAHTYFVLRLLGFSDVRTYHRSWAEWGASDDLPKAVAQNH
ncbi:MAG: rhodanese-like domain-containing protein [Pseudomonadota bacterium]